MVTVQRATGSCRASAYEMGRKAAAAAADMPRTCRQPKRQCVSAAGAPRFSGSSGAVGLSRHGGRTPDTRQTLSWVKSSVGRCSNPARLANRALAAQALWYVREHKRERKRVWGIVERIQKGKGRCMVVLQRSLHGDTYQGKAYFVTECPGPSLCPRRSMPTRRAVWGSVLGSGAERRKRIRFCVLHLGVVEF